MDSRFFCPMFCIFSSTDIQCCCIPHTSPTIQAYDLAALKFRGEEAITNFEFYEAERATADKLSRDQVVQSLRDQSKAMNKINSSSLRVSMEPWELALSAAIHPGRLHVGVYGSEIEAARAYDRGLVAALGLESAPLLNFNIVDYLDQFSPEQVHQGVNRGLMPSMLPPNWRPPPVPMPKWHLGSLLAPRCQDRFVGYNMEGVGPDAASNNNQSAENQAQDGPVPRRTSITPRSVLDDFSDDLQEAGSPMLFDGTIADNLDIIDLCDWDESDLKNIQ